jgi:hypothetical protein
VFLQYAAFVCVLLGSFICGTNCRSEPEEPKKKIESITFDKEKVGLKIDEEITVKVTVGPAEARKNEAVAYTSVNEGIIEIREASNNGFIV